MTKYLIRKILMQYVAEDLGQVFHGYLLNKERVIGEWEWRTENGETLKWGIFKMGNL